MFFAFVLVLSSTMIFCSLSYASSSSSTCLPGIPCTRPLTPNQNFIDSDGPNVLGPNRSRLGDEDDSCDADFLNQMHARAYMEAERENLMAEIILRKPDSVLEYSCFQKFPELVAGFNPQIIDPAGFVSSLCINDICYDPVGGPFFSEFEKWWNKDIDMYMNDETTKTHVYMGGGVNLDADDDGEEDEEPTFSGDHLDFSLQNLVYEALYTYNDSNFEHLFLGGAAGAQLSSLPLADRLDGGDFDFNIGLDTRFNDNELDPIPSITLSSFDITSLSDLVCANMQLVWQIARCGNFYIDDRFYSFEFLAGASTLGGATPVNVDPRRLPAACSSGVPFGLPMTQIPHNTRWYESFGGSVPSPDVGFVNYDQDKFVNYRESLSIIDFTTHNNCDVDAIPTGLKISVTPRSIDSISGQVVFGTTKTYDEKICPNPGCYYDPDTDDCKP